MRKIGMLVLSAILLVGCGSEGVGSGNALDINTVDIKGTIVAQPDNTSDLNQNSNGFSSKGKSIAFNDKGEMNIYLVKDDLETIEGQLSRSPLYSKFEILDKGENFFSYYLEKTGFDNEESIKGYGFRVVLPYSDDSFVCIDGRGTDMFAPIATKEINQEFLDIALTFKKK